MGQRFGPKLLPPCLADEPTSCWLDENRDPLPCHSVALSLPISFITIARHQLRHAINGLVEELDAQIRVNDTQTQDSLMAQRPGRIEPIWLSSRSSPLSFGKHPIDTGPANLEPCRNV